MSLTEFQVIPPRSPLARNVVDVDGFSFILDHLSTDNVLAKAVMTQTEYEQEKMAVQTMSGHRAFGDEYIDGSKTALFELDRIDLPTFVPVLFLGVDPNAGSLTKSDLACCALFPTASRRCVIAGLMSFAAGNVLDEQRSIQSFISHLRTDPAFRNSIIVPIVENNMKYECVRILTYMNPNLGNFVLPKFGQKLRDGPSTTAEIKVEWRDTVLWLMANQLLRFSARVLTMSGCSGQPPNLDYDSPEVFDLLRTQMRGMRFYRTETGKLSMTGKNMGKNPRDDLCNAVLIAVTNHIAFMQADSDMNQQLVPSLRKLGYNSIFPSG
jgi:hypothetical protein